MSKVLWLVGRNIPLGHHENYSNADMEAKQVFGNYGAMHSSEKHMDRTVATIVNGLSQYSVAELLAREWDLLPPKVRMAVMNKVNTGNHSGNVRKGITYLNTLLGGKLRRQEVVQTERVVRVGADGRLVRDTQAINQAAASASRAFAIVSLPAGYENMKPSQKRRVQQDLARARRNR